MPRTLSLLLACLLCLPAFAQEGHRYALLIGGLGGQPTSKAQFQRYLSDTRTALTQQFGFDANRIIVLGEDAALPGVAARSTADNIRAQVATLAAQVTPEDQVLVVLFGHGNFNGTEAFLNIPRRDLGASDYAGLMSTLRAALVVFVNTSSSSGPFVEALSGPGRIVVTATRSGGERTETVFPRFLVEALQTPATADLDKNGDLSVLEWFRYASEQTERWYESSGHLATEHALLEDTGDAEGAMLGELDNVPEGNLAAVTYLRSRAATFAAEVTAGTAAQAEEKATLERAIVDLKSRKTTLDEDAYYAELETLFIRLARLNESIEGS